MNYALLAPLALKYGWRIAKEYLFVYNYLKPTVNNFCTEVGFELNKHQQKNLFRNYPLFTVCANADNYLHLKKRSISYFERKKITLMGIMASLCDELLDEDGWTVDQLIALHNNEIDPSLLSQKARLILRLNETFKTSGNIPSVYYNQLYKAFIAQADSFQQMQPGLDYTQTMQITKEKGGQSNLLIARLLDVDWTENEINLIYQTGVVGQLVNDIFDTYKDLHQDIYTVVSKVSSMHALYDVYLEECRKLNQLIWNVDAPKYIKSQTIARLCCIPAFGFVALRQLKEVQDKYPIPPSQWKSVPRKELIVDMELKANMFRLAKYTVFCSNLR